MYNVVDGGMPLGLPTREESVGKKKIRGLRNPNPYPTPSPEPKPNQPQLAGSVSVSHMFYCLQRYCTRTTASVAPIPRPSFRRVPLP